MGWCQNLASGSAGTARREAVAATGQAAGEIVMCCQWGYGVGKNVAHWVEWMSEGRGCGG